MFSYAETTIPNGDDGAVETMRVMARLVHHDAVHPLVRAVASDIVTPYMQRDPVGACEAIRRWCASNIRFTRDPSDRELLHSPEAQLRQYEQTKIILGDCDDAAILAAGLAVAVGCRARFVAVAFLDSRNPFAHVWAEIAPPTGTGAEWIECDVTRSFQSIPVQSISRVLVFPVVS